MTAKSRASSFQSDADEARSTMRGRRIIDPDKADNYSIGRRIGKKLIERILCPASAIDRSLDRPPIIHIDARIGVIAL